MFKDITRNRLMGFWFAVVAVIIAFVVSIGVNVSISTAALLLTLSVVPPGIILALWRDAPPTVGEILHAVHTPKDGR